MYSNLLPGSFLLSILSTSAICRVLVSGCDTESRKSVQVHVEIVETYQGKGTVAIHARVHIDNLFDAIIRLDHHVLVNSKKWLPLVDLT
jgi:hypothetical protein